MVADGIYGIIWPHLAPYWPIWSHMAPCGAMCVHMVHMEPIGPVSCHKVACGPMWRRMAPNDTILAHMRPYAPIWAHMGPCGTVWGPCCALCTISKKSVQLYGKRGACLICVESCIQFKGALLASALAYGSWPLACEGRDGRPAILRYCQIQTH